MAHEISEIDQQEGITQAWHNLTIVSAVILLATCWLAKWDVRKRPLFRMFADGSKEETESCDVTCTDNEKITIGNPVSCRTYTLLTNAGFLAIVQDTLNKIPGAIVASVGSVCRRARIFVSLQLPPMNSDTLANSGAAKFFAVNAAGREFQCHLNFLSSHDKSAPFTVVLSTTCTVCNNTFSMNLADKDGDKLRISVKHTSGMADTLKDVPAIVDAFFVSSQRFAERMNALASIPCSAREARAFFAGFLTEKDNDETDEADDKEIGLSTRKLNIISRLVELFSTGKGNNGQNFADVFSALTDFYSHESAGGSDNVEKQFSSSEFGSGATMKAAAFVVLGDDKRVASLIALGTRLLISADANT